MFPSRVAHMPLVDFHLDDFLSRDRPSDFVYRERRAMPLGDLRHDVAFTHFRTEKRPIAEVHFGFWVSTRHAIRLPPSSEKAGRCCPGLFPLSGLRTPACVCRADSNFRMAVGLRRCSLAISNPLMGLRRLHELGRQMPRLATFYPCNHRPFSVLMGPTPCPSARVRAHTDRQPV